MINSCVVGIQSITSKSACISSTRTIDFMIIEFIMHCWYNVFKIFLSMLTVLCPLLFYFLAFGAYSVHHRFLLFHFYTTFVALSHYHFVSPLSLSLVNYYLVTHLPHLEPSKLAARQMVNWKLSSLRKTSSTSSVLPLSVNYRIMNGVWCNWCSIGISNAMITNIDFTKRYRDSLRLNLPSIHYDSNLHLNSTPSTSTDPLPIRDTQPTRHPAPLRSSHTAPS